MSNSRSRRNDGSRPQRVSNDQRQPPKARRAAIHQCNVCKNPFQSEGDLIAHQRDKHSDGFSQCSKCQRRFASAQGLKEHYRGSPHHPNCPFCGLGFQDTKECLEHQALDHPSPEEKSAEIEPEVEIDTELEIDTESESETELEKTIRKPSISLISDQMTPLQLTFSPPERAARRLSLPPSFFSDIADKDIQF
ncbi:hypothetical protein C8J56DRAFT_959455 [Mycena floridula]|nr:hypothetical protein C8J56DRAFT_959455 [Mycena floridula]